MDFKERLILLFIIQAVGLVCQNPIWKCTKEVSNCPITKELWYKRYEEFPCFKEGLNYTCMIAVGGVLVEACINDYAVLAFTGSRCPYIHSCDGIEPALGIEGTWPLCPENVSGCPPSDHPRYTVTEMYKYPACIVRKVTEVITTVLSEDLTSSTFVTMEPNVTKNSHSNKQATNSYIPGIAAGVAVTVVIILLSIIVICVIKRKRGERSNRRGHDEETQLFLQPTGNRRGRDEETQLFLQPTGNRRGHDEETQLFLQPTGNRRGRDEETQLFLQPTGNRRGHDEETQLFLQPTGNRRGHDEETQLFLQPTGNRRGRDEETQLFLQPTGNRRGHDEETQLFLQPTGNRRGRDEETQLFLQPTGNRRGHDEETQLFLQPTGNRRGRDEETQLFLQPTGNRRGHDEETQLFLQPTGNRRGRDEETQLFLQPTGNRRGHDEETQLFLQPTGNRRGRDEETQLFLQPTGNRRGHDEETQLFLQPTGNRRGRDEETQLFLQPTGNRRGHDEETQLFLQPTGNRRGRDEETQLFLQPTGHFHHLKKKLVTLSKTMTEKVILSPVQIYANIPVELLYAKVVIQTDARYVQLGRQYYQDSNLEMEQKTVKKPDDIFFKNKEQTKRIFMVGNAAHGKTMYCLWLLQHWYHAQSEPKGTSTHDEWGKAVGNFDFVFLIQLRAVKKSSATIIDMICKDLLKVVDIEYIGWLTKALKSGKYCCLILIDGLDQWKPEKNVTEDVRFNGMPITDDIENCVIFFTMRPWKFEEISKEVSSEDLVIEILGLDKHGIQEVIKNVLFKQYRLNVEKPEAKLKYDTIMKKMEHKTLASIMKIPLLAVLCVKIWYERDEIGNSLTSFYTSMVNMLVERAKGLDENDRNHDHSQELSTSCFIDKNLLLKLGKLAYNGLMTGLYIFEKPAKTILSDLGLTKSEYEFSLDVGLLSREEVDSSVPKKVKIYFFHASLQEYFSAVYIVKNEEIRNSFFQHLSSVKTILEFDNVLVFLSGLNAKLGSDISKRIVKIANEAKEVSEYRTTVNPLANHYREVQLMYKLQVSCYRELKYIRLCTDPPKPVVPFHVSDVYEGGIGSDKETIRNTVDILTYYHAEIRSLFMLYVPTDVENGVPDSILTQYLDHTVSLQSLSIYGGDRTLHHISDIFSSLTTLLLHDITLTTEALSTLQTKLQSNTVIQTLGLSYIHGQDRVDEGHVLASLGGVIQVLPDLPCLTTLSIGLINKVDKPVLLDELSRLSGLHNITYDHGTYRSDDEYHDNVVKTLCTFSGLRSLRLSNVNLSGCELQLQNDMLYLEKVILFYVEMSPSAWNNFIRSVTNINHQFDISLGFVNIDEESVASIRSSPQLRISQKFSGHGYQFTRVWPPPK